MKIVAALDLPDKYVKQLEGNYPVQVTVCTDDSKLREALQNADVLIASWHLPDDIVKEVTTLKWIHSIGAGVDDILTPELAESRILLTNSSGIHRIPISEHVFGFMLSFVRGFHIFARQQMEKKWNRFWLDELAGKTVGIVGLGEIGSEIAVKAKSFGMRVLATKRTAGEKPEHVDELIPRDRLEVLLSKSDFVVLSLPLTPTTHGLIGEQELRSMKKTGFLINISRGKIVQEDKLIRALREGWIAGAGLDVFEEEPLPAESELWEMPNVIVTPHVAGSNLHYTQRAMSIFEENLKRFLKGEEMVNLVDKQLGY